MVSWKGIYFILSLFWGSFFGSIFMMGPFLPLMFVNPSWYRWINNRLVATWLTFPVAMLETMFGVKVLITGDAFVPGERSVIIMNHRTRMDWMFLWNCLMRYSYLRLEKICLKASLKSVPGFGPGEQCPSRGSSTLLTPAAGRRRELCPPTCSRGHAGSPACRLRARTP
ncbi:lysocardiolipin acyltransferase 1 [Rhinolophus ferrumequinum]|uniref:Lysocardiolipin acyltransferase 1 n=1 Tax=Rhinolophus ferrumequinum TaxID=59479 RepID=A0A7J7V7W7_RHIFE|nr:lysocardiolipin acyltransferase 1 [Rhinolophus ferrumequinum]